VELLEDRRLLSVTLVSANALGQAAGVSVEADQSVLSDNGQWVAFVSAASAVDLGVPNVTDDAASDDVFLKNLQSGQVTLVSALGGAAVGGSTPSISADGRYVAFTTNAGGFATGAFTDTNGSSNDVYVFDAQANTYTLASAANGATAAVGSAIQPSLSNNGRVVAFVTTTSAATLVSGAADPGSTRDVFVRNLDTNQTVLISVNTAGAATGNAASQRPSISGDGNFVAFESAATDLSSVADAGTAVDVFRRAVAGTTTDLVSITSAGGGTPAGGATPSVNADGSLVAFESADPTLAAGDPGGAIDVFVRNMATGVTNVVSTSAAGTFGNGNSRNPSISDDGTRVAFQSVARNLTADPDSTVTNVFVKNRTDQGVVRVSQTDAGEAGTAGGGGVSSNSPSVNANGTAVSFVSQATNFAPGTEAPTAATEDLFLWRSADVLPGDTTPPTATITAPNVNAAGGATQSVTVVYADNAAVDVSSIDSNDITVTGPGPAATPLTVSAVAATPDANAASVSVVYTVAAPGGAWDAADNGTYTITLPANAVRDTAANGVAAASQTFAVDTTGGGTGGPGADLTAAFAPKPAAPAAVVGGTKGLLRVLVTNAGDTAVAAGAVNILLQAVPTGSTTGAPTDVTTVTRPLRLKAGKSRAIPLKFNYPALPDGTYNIVATVDSAGAVTESNDSNNSATTAAPVTIAAPFVDLTAEVGAPVRGSLPIGRRAIVPVILTNAGNVPGAGTITIDLFASGDNVLGGDAPLASVTKKVKLRNGRPRTIRLGFLVPADLAAGSYFIGTSVDATGVVPPESAAGNNTAIGATPVLAS
jgi:Tol biopolymer transport system component